MFTAFKLFFSPPEFLRPFGSKRHSRAGGARGGLIRLLCVLIIIPIPVYFRTSALYTLFRRLEQLVQTACTTRTDTLYTGILGIRMTLTWPIYTLWKASPSPLVDISINKKVEGRWKIKIHLPPQKQYYIKAFPKKGGRWKRCNRKFWT